jgi:hypothetical protein
MSEQKVPGGPRCAVFSERPPCILVVRLRKCTGAGPAGARTQPHPSAADPGLDQQLIGGGKGLGDLGFGAEVKDALRQRADFLIEQGLAEHRGQRVVLARNLLATLRGRELANAAQEIATETGLEHRPVADGNT